MNPLERIRLEKAAADCGFERTAILNQDGVLELRSAQFPEIVCLSSQGAVGYRLVASLPALLDNPGGGSVLVSGVEQLYAVLQHASAVARNLPNRIADQFRAKTKGLPTSTEAERLVLQRVGQDLFRIALLDFWRGRCCVTGLAVPSLLRASHIKPWAKCESDNERLDVFNGLLLAPHIDALFDGGWVSFSDQGGLLVSKELSSASRHQLGVVTEWSIKGLTPSHSMHLMYHREQVFRNG
ncbi:HNH endonuclease [Comamonas aquatica]|uniref:HNH endonuclease n=1 Tax=Comamonas aquatica TaxID=225991 RepID=A0AA43AVT4_9BURK|nr:HNH endonuclease signature motif containing protein [Comamonas aquatica]MDH1426766.1 HNH endonuclease [Comamonas aquatica]MDH1604243.1 HNH endonuclease [Comamonas aquatica]MDH1616135.1 HNH endonuclease [Comamonas aquatica]MDH2003984.1 HNH endonuclease [Comamonas aquatica]